MQGIKMSVFDWFCPVLSHLFLVFLESSTIKVLVSSEKKGGYPKVTRRRVRELFLNLGSMIFINSCQNYDFPYIAFINFIYI